MVIYGSFHWVIMGKSGSCNNLKTACSFLMKLATWIDSRVEIMHIFFTLSAQY